MDSVDHKLISLLRENAKLTIAQLADAVNRSPTPIHERIKKLEKKGIITGYSAQINESKIDRGFVAYSQIGLNAHTHEHITGFVAAIRSFPEVEECHHIAGNFDYLLKVRVKDINAYQQFLTEKLSGLNHVKEIRSSFSLQQVK